MNPPVLFFVFMYIYVYRALSSFQLITFLRDTNYTEQQPVVRNCYEANPLLVLLLLTVSLGREKNEFKYRSFAGHAGEVVSRNASQPWREIVGSGERYWVLQVEPLH